VPTIGNCASAQNQRQSQQDPARGDAVDDEADNNGRDRKQEEERGAEQSELFRLELQLAHDRTPARPTTILSAKFTSMKRNRRNVILQALLASAAWS